VNASSEGGAPQSFVELSQEVSRIAATLARLAEDLAHSTQVPESSAAADQPDISTEMVNWFIRARRRRGRYFPEELFADPTWDMMLDLLAAELSYRPVAVSSLCVAAAVPATTALRHIRSMVQKGMLIRRQDMRDGRRVYVELSPEASGALRRYFADLNQIAPT
jgi:DNA-binding transcriptional ArsR family regulator